MSFYKIYFLFVINLLNCFGSKEIFEIVHQWKKLDFEYPTYKQRQSAIETGAFISENNLPLGIDRHKDRLFITTPRWKDGVPASLNYLSYPPKERSPPLKPYPNWEAHGDPYNPDCSKLISVYRTFIDECDRLWLIDSGIVNATVKLNQICLPKIIAYDLNTNELIVQYNLPADQVKQDSLHSNIIVETDRKHCDKAYAYVTDVWRYGLVVFSLSEMKSWRVTNYLFSPEPYSADFKIYNLNFQWLDGIFGMSLTNQIRKYFSSTEQYLFFHPMASTKEYLVPTHYLHNATLAAELSYKSAQAVRPVGDRGEYGQSSTSGFARNGVMFFTQVHRDNIACWHAATPYNVDHIGLLLEENNNLIKFPNDLKVDKNPKQSIWVMSNSLPIFLYSSLNYTEINFRIIRADVETAVTNTVCSNTAK